MYVTTYYCVGDINMYILSQASFRRHSLHNSINTVPQVKSKTMFFVSHLNFDPVKRPSSGWMAVISITHHYYMITNKFEDLLVLHSLGASVIPWEILWKKASHLSRCVKGTLRKIKNVGNFVTCTDDQKGALKMWRLNSGMETRLDLKVPENYL